VSALLALTDNAVQAVRDINFQLSIVPLPAEDDEVIEEHDARVFLEPEAASLLDDKVLDATVESNRVAFTIADQAAA
jgi:iron-sulfur cluster assembly protein